MLAAMEATERQYTPGERVPGTEYVVIRLEAEGGHGALYLVRHHFLEKKIQMLKTLRAFEPSKDLIERLKREAQMLAAMDHPHIVSVTSGGLTDEKEPRPYFVMERLKGRSLAQVLPEAPEGVGVDAALKVTIELCDALEYVHVRHGVVHRDIKPDNIFLHVTPRNGSVTKILDFGVAHIMDLEKRYTKSNLFLGTPRYASPEQIMGDRPTPQTDLYAVGLVLYELLLGHGPFDDAQTFAAVATAHVQKTPPGFPTTRRFPEGLEPLVMSMLAKDPKERPRSAEWLAVQLRQIKRIAELAEQMGGGAVSQTDLSPVQNALTGHRAQLTEAGPPPDLASEPELSATAAPESSIGPPDTLRLAAPAPPPPSFDRAAPTRSLMAELPEPRRTDTEQLPRVDDWLPVGESRESRHPATGRGGTMLSAEQAGTSTHASVELTRSVERRARSRWGAAVAGAAVGLGVVGLAVVLYARGAAPTGTGSEAPASPTVEVASAPPTTAPAVATAAATPALPASPPVTATPPPAASANAEPAATPAAPPPTRVQTAASAPTARPRTPAPQPAMKLPPSGLD